MKAKIILQYWKKHPLSSFFIVLQLTAILVLTAAASSATSTALQYYKPFSDYFRSQGMFLELTNVSLDNKTVCENSKDLEDVLKSATVLSCYTLQTKLQGSSNVTFRAYDPDIINRYHPKLATGSWLTPEVTPDNMLHAVVWGVDANVGDILEAVADNNETIPIKVIGILDDNATIVGHTSGSREAQSDYMQMYTQFTQETLVGSTILLNQAEVLAAKKRYPDIISPMSDMVLIKYDKDIDQTTANLNNVLISKYANTLNGYYMTDINSQSLRNIRPTLYFFIPILIAAFSLMCVSAICSNAIVTEERLYSYAIFRLCGMSRKQCIFLNFCHIILAVIVSEVINSCIMQFLINGRSIMNTPLHYELPQFICCLCIGVFYMFLSFIQPYLALRKQTIHTILIDQTGKGQ